MGRAAQTDKRFEVGQPIKITATALVTRHSDSHGLCYEVVFPQKDYSTPRKIWLEADEVEAINAKQMP
jgi:hypothetical protein